MLEKITCKDKNFMLQNTYKWRLQSKHLASELLYWKENSRRLIFKYIDVPSQQTHYEQFKKTSLHVTLSSHPVKFFSNFKPFL